MTINIDYVYHTRHSTLANRLLQYFCGSYFSKKYNLILENDIDLDKKYFDINKPIGIQKYNNFIEINDNNILSFLNNTNCILQSGIQIKGFFQQKELFQNIDYLNFCKNSIISKIPESDKIDLFVHVRLGEVADAGYNLPFNYYDNQIKKIKCDNIAISTDTPNHPIIKELLNKYKKSYLFQAENPSHAIAAGSHANNLIIGSGSFGFSMALFSKPETNIYCISHQEVREIFNTTIYDGTMIDAFRNRNNTYFFKKDEK